MTENAKTEAQVNNNEQAETTETPNNASTEEKKKNKTAEYIESLQTKVKEFATENEELQAQLKEIAKQTYLDETAKKEREEKLQKVKSSIPSSDKEKLDEVLEKYPTLDPVDAYKLVRPDEFVEWKSFELSWSVKRQEKKELTPEEKKEALKQSLLQWHLQI